MESLYTLLILFFLVLTIAVPYWRKVYKHRQEAKQIHEKSVRSGLIEPATLHPKIDVLSCIGCGSCVKACPEEVLGLVNGRATIISGARCIGHTTCEQVCPVGAITMGFGSPKQGMEIPYYNENYETNIKGLYIVGELGGIGLIKNAFDQGIKAVQHITNHPSPRTNGVHDVVIVGAGPAGVAASLAAQSARLDYLLLEQGELGGSILHYPRQKLVLTKPVELPLHGKIKVSEISKEELLELFTSMTERFRLQLKTQQKVESIVQHDKTFQVNTPSGSYFAKHVILAIGRRGSPRKLGVPGEHLPKVLYRLIEAESYQRKQVLVVGGGDSAIEAAIALARQRGTTITLSYRKEAFVRLKTKNEQGIQEMINSGKIKAIFNSQVLEIQDQTALVQEEENILHNLKNDFVFVFAGGELPSEFLKKIGVSLRTTELELKVA